MQSGWLERAAVSERIEVSVDLNAKCSRCGKSGATPSGFCLGCGSARILKQLKGERSMALVDTKTGEVVAAEWERRADVEAVIYGLVGAVHRHLGAAHFVAIGRPECAKKHSKQVWASVKLASPMERVLADEDINYIIMVGLDVWTTLPEEMRVALIDHELSHCGGFDDKAEKWTIVGHDIEEFGGVLQRRGAWQADLVAFLEIAQKVDLPQASFGFPEQTRA